MKHQRFIPSQRIKGSDKEVFIINYEGAVIEVQRTSNLYEPLVVRLNGELLETIPSKQNKEIEFSTPEGKHKIQVWNERVENNLIPKIFVKDGIAVVIDGIPVQNTLADPITRLTSGRALIWLLTVFFFVRAFVIPFTTIKDFSEIQHLPIVFIYIFLFILLLSSALTFKLHPVRSTWIALILSFLELAWYIFSIIITIQIGLLTLLYLLFRIAIFSGLVFTLKNLKQILDFGDEQSHFVSESLSEQKEAKQSTFQLKYAAILIFSIVIICGLYLVINEIIKISNEPSLERDSSLEFRTDLNLPELIPYRKGNKWGYCDRNKKIIIEPMYEEANLFNEKYRTAIVKFNGLFGIIDDNGKKKTPYIYDKLECIANSPNYFIANKGRRFGVIDLDGNTIIPFNYFDLKYFEEVFIASIYKGDNEYYGILDTLGHKITAFIYDEIDVPHYFKYKSIPLKEKSRLIFIGSLKSEQNNP